MVRPTALTKQPGAYWLSIGSRLPARGSRPMLLVVSTPTCGMWSNTYWMMGTAVVTIPEGTVNGPDRDLPKNSIVKVALGIENWGLAVA